MPHLSRFRRTLLCAALGAGALGTTASTATAEEAPTTRPFDVTIALQCRGTFNDGFVGRSVRMTGDAPLQTSVGESVALQNTKVVLTIGKEAPGSATPTPIDVTTFNHVLRHEGVENIAYPGALWSEPSTGAAVAGSPEPLWTTTIPRLSGTTVRTKGTGDVTFLFGTVHFEARTTPSETVGDGQYCEAAPGQPAIATVENRPAQPEPTPTPTPTPDPVVDYTGSGSVTFASANARGTMPFGGRLDDATFARGAGTFTGNLTLSPASAGLTVGGFLPVTARLEFGVQGPLSGRWGNGPISAEAQVAVKVPRITTFGLQLGGGANCRAKDPSTLRLLGTSAAFDPAAGGQLVGSLPISQLVGCGILNGTVSPLLAGKGHSVAFNLRPVAAAS